MTKTVSEILFAAADLIEPEGAWTQRAIARDRKGLIAIGEGTAVCWCAIGAIIKVGGAWEAIERTEKLLALPDAARVGDLRPLAAFNDAPERTQEEVVAKLREAAERAREQGQ